jgi:hypothetical protein
MNGIRMNAMRETRSFSGSGLQFSSRLAARALRLAAIVIGVGLVLGAGPLHAQDAEETDDGKTFERKLIDNLMSGLGGKKIDDGTIDYRERSPLVVPSKIDLPPPQTGRAKLAPNWPKDPDEAERKAAREAYKQKEKSPEEQRMPLMPSEMVQKKPRGSKSEPVTPGGNNSNSPIMMLPSELGYTSGLFSNPFGGGKPEAEKFVSEPERTDLTQPPSGYQTPSPNFAYGTGQIKAPKEVCDSGSGRCEKRWD